MRLFLLACLLCTACTPPPHTKQPDPAILAVLQRAIARELPRIEDPESPRPSQRWLADQARMLALAAHHAPDAVQQILGGDASDLAHQHAAAVIGDQRRSGSESMLPELLLFLHEQPKLEDDSALLLLCLALQAKQELTTSLNRNYSH